MPLLPARLRARWRLRRIGLWHHPGYHPDCLARTARVPRLPLERVEEALGQLGAEGVLRRGDLRTPRPIGWHHLLRVHTHGYLESTTRAETLARIFALEDCSHEVEDLLLAQRLACGGTLAAVRAACARRVRVAVNLGGGFHHAEPERGGGFCVYNDVAVAIEALRARGDRRPVAVVDLDYHQGDGTRAVFADEESVLTYSLHGSTWSHAEARADFGLELDRGTADEAYMETLRHTLPDRLAAHGTRLVVLVAGHDVLQGDALGDFALTPAGAAARDRYVLEWALARGIPVVVVLGGGYGRAGASCVASLVRWLLTGDTALPGTPAAELRRHFTRIAAQLDPAELQREPGGADWTLSEEELLSGLAQRSPPPRLLDFYTSHGVELALERYGLLGRLRRHGFDDLRVEVDPSQREHQIVRLTGRHEETGKSGRLVELVLRRRWLDFPRLGRRELLSLEWMLLEDPSADFHLERQALPGQEHPGLGLAAESIEMLVQACRRLGLAGIVARPAWYHSAAMAARVFRFLDPEAEGRFQAWTDALAGLGVAEAARALDAGRLREDGQPARWEPADHVLPVAEEVLAWFASEEYRDAVADSRRRWSARLETSGEA